MNISLNKDGYVENYALIGALVDGIDVPDPEDMENFEINYSSYKYQDGQLVFNNEKYTETVAKELLELQEKKQSANNTLLAKYLSANPITWTDGKKYGVTQADQQEIALNLTQYQLSTAAGLQSKLEWHAIHEECREFTQKELSGLALAISEYVYPLVRKNQAYKTQIYATANVDELDEIVISYE